MMKKLLAIATVALMAVSVAGSTISTTVNTDAPYSGVNASADPYEVKRSPLGVVTTIRDDGTCGITNFTNDYLEYEALAGLRVHCHDNTKIDYTCYSHTSKYTEGDIYFYRGHDKNSELKLDHIKMDETKTIDIKDMIAKLPAVDDVKGLYSIKIDFGNDQQALQNLYYDGSVVKACRCNSTIAPDMEKWKALVGNLDPKDCLDLYVGNPNVPITYPTSGTDGKCNHVKAWCDKSDEIIFNDDWTDEAKVWACVFWLVKNVAYDDYRVDKLKNASRATEAQCWTDDKLWTLGNNVGQCWDYANIMTIMLRNHGVPCTSAENTGHTVNLVWLRDEWVAIDVSALVQYHCATKDTDKSNWTKCAHADYTWLYGYYDNNMDTYNQALATPETTLVYMSGHNPM